MTYIVTGRTDLGVDAELWTLRLRDTSPTGQFAYYLDISPTRPNMRISCFTAFTV